MSGESQEISDDEDSETSTEIIPVQAVRVDSNQISDALSAITNGNASLDQLMLCRNMIDLLMEFAKAADKAWDARMFAYVQINGSVVVGPITYYIARPSSVKDRGVGTTFQIVMDAAEGDVDKIAGCLSTNAWKHGAVKKLLKESGQIEKYDLCFVKVTAKDRLGKEKPKQLQRLDTTFLK